MLSTARLGAQCGFRSLLSRTAWFPGKALTTPRSVFRAESAAARYSALATTRTVGVKLTPCKIGLVRMSANTTKPKNVKAVGYWLLGCSGMVFVAVILGTASGYFILLYCVYYLMDIILRKTVK